MLSVWFRSQPAQSSCRCISCLSSGARLLARRPTASAEPWRLQFKHLTTLFYSSIIATAAAADAKAKQRRREQWILAIAEAERSIQELKERSDASKFPYPDDIAARQEEVRVDTLGGAMWDARTQSQTVSRDKAARTNVKYELPFNRGRPSLLLPRIEAEVRRIIEQNHQRNGSRRKHPFVIGSSKVAPTSIYASYFQRAKWRPSWSTKKVVTLELSMAKLTTQFLIKISPETTVSSRNPRSGRDMSTKSGESPIAIDISSLKQRLAEISARLKTVESYDANGSNELESVDYPRYTPDIDGRTKSAIQLNKALIILLRSFACGDLDLEGTLSRISYSLLISPAPPDLKTYTILLTQFSRLGYHDLVTLIIESLFESHVRPDEMTVSAIIAHYSRKGDLNGFTRFVEKLEGHHGGLMLAHPSTPTDRVGASRLRRWKDKVIQRISFDPYIYYGVIAAYLKFDKFSCAIHWYNCMLEDGLDADVQLLTDFLRYFTAKLDWARGYGTWQNIKLQLLDGSVDRRKERQAYILMLEHCRVCSRSAYFREVQDEALQRGFPYGTLLIPGSVARGFTYQEDAVERLRRKGRILKHRSTMITETIRAWAVQLLAAKIILWGLNVEVVQEVFRQHANQNAYEDWLGERPWLSHTNKPAISDPAGHFVLSGDTKQEDGTYASETTLRFGPAVLAMTTSPFKVSGMPTESTITSKMADRRKSHTPPATCRLNPTDELKSTSTPTEASSPIHLPGQPGMEIDNLEEGFEAIEPQHPVHVHERRHYQRHKHSYAENRHIERHQAPLVATYG